MRLAAIYDPHLGPDRVNRLGTAADKALRRIIHPINSFQPDAVINGGDLTTAYNADEARCHMQRVRSYYNHLAAPIFDVVGNVDLKFLSRAENEEINGNSAHSYSREVNGYHLIFWNPGIKEKLDITPENLKWLTEDLRTTRRPVIVFSHVPLDLQEIDFAGDASDDLAGRRHFEQSEPIREMLERSGKVGLCLSGHRHRHQYQNINGIHYIQQQSLTQKWRERNGIAIPYRAWSSMEAAGNHISLKMHGHARPKVYELTIPAWT